MSRNVKNKFTDFGCKVTRQRYEWVSQYAFLAKNLPTEDVDELLLKIIGKSEK